MNTLIEEASLLVIRHGGSVKIVANPSQDGILFDLNTGMKSGLQLYSTPEGKVYAVTRYNPDEEVQDMRDVVYAASDCLCGRDYASQAWLNIFDEYGLKVEGVHGNK